MEDVSRMNTKMMESVSCLEWTITRSIQIHMEASFTKKVNHFIVRSIGFTYINDLFVITNGQIDPTVYQNA